VKNSFKLFRDRKDLRAWLNIHLVYPLCFETSKEQDWEELLTLAYLSHKITKKSNLALLLLILKVEKSHQNRPNY